MSYMRPFLIINFGFLIACSITKEDSSLVHARLSIEDILKVPIEQGAAGRKQIVTRLIEVAKYPNPPDAKPGTSTLRHPITLRDGYRITELYDYGNPDRISLSIDRTPCFKLGKAIEYTSAKLTSVIHAYTLYDTYSILKDGAKVSFGTANPKDECIASIHIGEGL